MRAGAACVYIDDAAQIILHLVVRASLALVAIFIGKLEDTSVLGSVKGEYKIKIGFCLGQPLG